MDVDGLAAVFLLPDGQPDGTLAPAFSQPSGQEFLRLDLGAVVSGKLVMVSGGLVMYLNVRVGDSRRRPEGGDRAPNGGAALTGR